VPQLLKVPQLAQQHRVPQVKVGRRRVKARFHPQRPSGFAAVFKALAQIGHADNLRRAFLQQIHLFINRKKRTHTDFEYIKSRPQVPVTGRIDSTTQDPAKELQKIGGANIILSTITSAKALEWVIDGLAPAGKFIVVGAPEDGPIVINPFPLLLGRRTVAGWPSGTGMDSEDTLKFSALTGVKPMNEIYPLEKAEEAYARMISGKARFRVVLNVSS
jgi:hypothetical protein